MNKFWGHEENLIFWVGSAIKKQVKLNAAGFRVVRPEKKGMVGQNILMHIVKTVRLFYTLDTTYRV